MNISQFRAVTGGRRRKPNYVAMINAQLPYLPSLMETKRQSEMADEMMKLEKKRFGIEEDVAETQKKRENLAMMLGLGNLGLKGYFGYKRNKALENILDATEVAEPIKKFAKISYSPGSPGPSITSETVKAKAPFFTREGVGTAKNWLESLTSFSPWVGGASGFAAGKLLGGKDKLKSGLAGAGAGGLTSWALSGGLKKLLTGQGAGADIYDTIVGSVLGGVFGGLF